MVVLTRSLNHISYMQKTTIGYIGEVAVFSSAIISDARILWTRASGTGPMITDWKAVL